MEVKRPLQRWRHMVVAALFATVFHPAKAQYPQLNPDPFPTAGPRAQYQLVDAFPGVTFPFRREDPVSVATPPGRTNELYVTGLFGKIFVITNLAAPTKSVFLDITADTYALGAVGSEAGLLGLAFHPKYDENGYFFVCYTRTNRTEQKIFDTLSRFQRDPDNPWRALPESEVVLFSQLDPRSNHQGGDVHFGPDGYLYVSLGDGGGGASLANTQRIDKDLFSGILRLDVDGRPGNLPPNPHPAVGTGYWIPSDNPFVGADSFNGRAVDPDRVRTEYWALGLRNPFRFAFDPLTGDIYAGDVGELRREEINRIVRGGNYGWGYFEGTLPYSGTPPAEFQGIPPIYEYGRSGGDPNFQGLSVIGGLVYRGSLYPELDGKYLFGDFATRHIWAATPDATQVSDVWKVLDSSTGMSSFGLHPATGEILVVELPRGRISKLVRNLVATGPVLPPTLSSTRVFSDLSRLAPADGVMPYQVATPFWSDYAIKQRWFFMQDPAGKITRDEENGWRFPTGTVWVKHFDLELVRGDASTRRRLETRFMVKTADSVYGITYKWRADGSDADLVPDAGLDEDIPVVEGGVSRIQRWHYPARSECLSCHTSAAGYALGFSSRQLNRDVEGDGSPVNQLLDLSARGVFDVPVASTSALPRMVAVDDETAPLDLRFKSYLDANCAYCHMPGGPGRGMWDARFGTSLAQAGIVDGPVVDDHGITGARVIKMGDPNLSLLFRRISEMGGLHMPPLGTSELNHKGIDVVNRWVTASRAHWMVGVVDRPEDAPPGVPFRPATEFSPENGRNNLPPGAVTRLPSDPEYSEASNPAADDDHYLAGRYPAGFNGLTAPLWVPMDEPFKAWERALGANDRTNRLHFVLGDSEAGTNAHFHLRFELTRAGFMVNGVLQKGFSEHDIVVRFRNSEGVGTVLYANRISRATTIDLEFSAASVGAKAGPNTIEFVRVGPNPPQTPVWILFNYVDLQVTNPPPVEEPPVDDPPVDDPPVDPPPVDDPPVDPNPVDPTPVDPPPSTNHISRWSLGFEDPTDGAIPKGGKSPYWEFTIENGKSDRAPGKVTRTPEDPLFDSATNPGADDDHYLAGTYPAGFNGLAEALVLPKDEPITSWERALTISDRTNRLHFVLGEADVDVDSTIRLRLQFTGGAYMLNGKLQKGFYDHDVVIRFRNAAGVETVLYTNRISKTTLVDIEVPLSSVGAAVGPNTVEFVRVGPRPAKTSAWVGFNFVQIQVTNPPGSQAPGNPEPTDPTPEPTPDPTPEPDPTPTPTPEPVEPRVVQWDIGDEDPTDAALPKGGKNPFWEFSIENGRNDRAPGKVTRVPEDPLYNPAANPSADDDHYLAGEYPAGFNQLAAPLSVGHDEPTTAWERALSGNDRTNRLHFVLSDADVSAESKARLRFQLTRGGFMVNGLFQRGFYDHDVVVRFRNAAGGETVLYANRISKTTDVDVEFSLASVGATAGPNTIEFVRVGPTPSKTGAWVLFNYLQLQVTNPNPPAPPADPPPSDPPPSDPPPSDPPPSDPPPSDPPPSDPAPVTPPPVTPPTGMDLPLSDPAVVDPTATP